MRRAIALIAIFSAVTPAVRAQLLVAPQSEEKSILSVSKDSNDPVSSIATINSQNATFYPASLTAAGIDLQKEIKSAESKGDEAAETVNQPSTATGSSAQSVKEAFKESTAATGFVEPSGLSKAISKDKPEEEK